MWLIEEHRRVDKQLSGSVPIEVLNTTVHAQASIVQRGPAARRKTR
jgi:hypothetical protein